jgi:hypothetical protein
MHQTGPPNQTTGPPNQMTGLPHQMTGPRNQTTAPLVLALSLRADPMLVPSVSLLARVI